MSRLDDFFRVRGPEDRRRVPSGGPSPLMEAPSWLWLRAHPLIAYTADDIPGDPAHYLEYEAKLNDPALTQYDLTTRLGPNLDSAKQVIHDMVVFLLNNPPVTRANADRLYRATVFRARSGLSWKGFDPDRPVSVEVIRYSY